MFLTAADYFQHELARQAYTAPAALRRPSPDLVVALLPRTTRED